MKCFKPSLGSLGKKALNLETYNDVVYHLHKIKIDKTHLTGFF